ncbi:interleukin-15 receptor subunit alpha isoform X2 [Gopherus flavomarginatus]|uniref:interleukin-15 receptor subunit alpha isoform X2 n=1 Tax=Gopherus flavomarginatus TaxID=286002 RepID=UPI0021CBEC2D|nr:interleukin-15 receptor subunit alpha isoform X2 [Gopherus flavomarginatus]
MARLLLLLCGIVGLLSAGTSAAALQERCSMPKEVNNADITVGNNNLLNASLRYTCKDGYKRKAGTSSLIVCVMDEVTKTLRWTEPNLHCIRDPTLPPLTSSPKQTTSAPRTEATNLVSRVTRVTAEVITVPVMASTPSYERETTSPLAGPVSQLRTDKPSQETLATATTEIRSSKGPGCVTMEDTTQQRTTATQDTHTSQLWTDKPLLKTVTTEGDWSTAVPASVTTGDSTQLLTAATHNTKVSTRVMLSSVGFPMLLTFVTVALCCVWRQRVHMRRQHTIPVIAIPMTTEESEQRDGTPPEDSGSNGPEEPSEGTEMMSSSCVTSTG